MRPIMIRGKLIDYREAVETLENLNKELNNIRQEVQVAEDKLISLKEVESNFNNQVREIVSQMEAHELTDKLPSHLLSLGYKLIEVEPFKDSRNPDFWEGAQPPSVIITVLQDRDGQVIRQWVSSPSLSDLLEIEVR